MATNVETVAVSIGDAAGDELEVELMMTGVDAADAAQAEATTSDDRRGIWLAVGAYGAWGILPIYFKALSNVPPLEMLANRIVWSLLFMVGVITWKRDWAGMRSAVRNRRAVAIYAVAAIIIAVNWYLYIWAVNAGHILDASLGYFINPLMNVVLGVLLLGERLRRGQWLAIAVAASGVAYLTWSYGQLPWVALVLAGTFAAYGVIKKKAPLPPEQGLTLETATLFLPALIALLWMDSGGNGALVNDGWGTVFLLMLAGPITAVPLLMFAGAAKRVPLSTLGVLQYLSPTGQFLIGVFLYNEPLSMERLVGFIIIWTALALFWLEGWRWRRAHR
jgi:chloramphenicol-sensitive protein RarD